MPRPKICTQCILPETFPGTRFDANGTCSHCRQEAHKAPSKKADYRQKLDNFIQSLQGAAPAYDVIAAYSGGKDSSYTLKLLKEKYGLRMLAMTFDNHFVSPASWQNIKTITNALQIDHITFRPPYPLMQSVFRLTSTEDIFPAPTLLRASSICTACIGMVKSLVLKTALEMRIPLVAFGWSPGQAPIQSAVMKTNPNLTRQSQKVFKAAFPNEIASQMESYLIPETHYELYKHSFPHNIHPLAFFDYDEERIKSELENLGWSSPTDTDSNSTNCLLNAFANHCHLDRHGFHPYVWEIANMVRQGDMLRHEGIEKIYTPQNQTQVAWAKRRLGL